MLSFFLSSKETSGSLPKGSYVKAGFQGCWADTAASLKCSGPCILLHPPSSWGLCQSRVHLGETPDYKQQKPGEKAKKLERFTPSFF